MRINSLKYYISRYTLIELVVLITALIFKKILGFMNYYKSILPYKVFLNELAMLNLTPKRTDQKSVKVSNMNFMWKMRINSSDIKVYKQIFVDKEYSEILNILDRLIIKKHKINILDCGSNIGLFSVWLSSIYPDSNIVCVEADTENFEFNKSIIQDFKIMNVRLLNRAVWHTSQEHLAIDNSFRDGKDWAKAVTSDITKNSKTVTSITLDDLYNTNFKGKKIDVLKIDIEGSEAKIFSHPESLMVALKNTRIIAIEIHDEFKCRNMIHDTLINCGFNIKEISETTFAYRDL
jgi:FkbM family methyltransferase